MLALLLGCRDQVAPCDDCDAVDDADGDGDPYPSDCDDRDETLTSVDGDGDGWSTCDGDCDDTDGDRGPRGLAAEICDDIDNDCNGVADMNDAGVRACEVAVDLDVPDLVSTDLLFVVHADGLMEGAIRDLQSTLPALVERLAGTDTHVAFALNNGGGALRGPIGEPWLDVAASEPDEVADWLRTTIVPGDLPNGTGRLDRSFDTAVAVLDGEHASTEGWRRPGADLAVVFVSNADDGSVTAVDQLDARLRREGTTAVDAAESETRQTVTVLPYAGPPGFATCAVYTSGLHYLFLATLSGDTARDICNIANTLPNAIGPVLPSNVVQKALEYEPIVVTLRAELQLTDGRRADLTVDDLQYVPGTDNRPPRVTIPGYRWDQISKGTIRYEVIPDELR